MISTVDVAETASADQCTWTDPDGRCTALATMPQVGQDGERWANLCGDHHRALEGAMVASVPRVLQAWVRAGGGPKAMAARMAPEAALLANAIVKRMEKRKP